MLKKKGFTLIEMLVVVLIIAVLAAIAFPQYEKAVNRTRLTEAFLLGRFFRDAQRMYFMRTGRYADTYEELGIDMPPYGVLVSPAKIRVKKYTYSIMGGEGTPRTESRWMVVCPAGWLCFLCMTGETVAVLTHLPIGKGRLYAACWGRRARGMTAAAAVGVCAGP